MNIQTYNGTHFILNNGKIIGDFARLSDAEGLVSANAKPIIKQKRKRALAGDPYIVPDIYAFGYNVGRMQQRK
jgi:hypothetical protein